jgi:hypothetical protein
MRWGSSKLPSAPAKEGIMVSGSTIPAPSKEKLAAWAQVRAAWKAVKPPYLTDAVLEAEYKAENTD